MSRIFMRGDLIEIGLEMNDRVLGKERAAVKRPMPEGYFSGGRGRGCPVDTSFMGFYFVFQRARAALRRASEPPS
jgi:hypothetical protein